MSDELFEVAFSGQIRAGENIEDVKARVGKMFNADETKIAQLFSGNRIVIKKNIDSQVAAKYQTALNRAGAECEIKSLTPPQSVQTPTATEPEPVAATASSPPDREVDYGEVEPPPQTDPLGISADQIADLDASIAPVGSVLQDDHKPEAEPQIDISGMDVAPVGSDLGSGSKEPDPPPPNTSGLSMAD